MNNVALVLLSLIAVGGLVLVGFTWLLQRALPASWPQAKRWSVAMVTTPSVFFLVILLLSGSGFLQEQLGQWLLP
ncbi:MULTISPECIES: hypothetical protein [Giesbergeria]|uniref:NADH dehydrogenase subunit 2 n=1 Tax=Giesbergeria sinuosa TaxID=80883 RepID=A0ABV9QGT1_9BURK